MPAEPTNHIAQFLENSQDNMGYLPLGRKGLRRVVRILEKVLSPFQPPCKQIVETYLQEEKSVIHLGSFFFLTKINIVLLVTIVD